MVYLPDVMPASFQATYTPVESAGTDAQIKHLARLMATQMTAARIGPGQIWPPNSLFLCVFLFFFIYPHVKFVWI